MTRNNALEGRVPHGHGALDQKEDCMKLLTVASVVILATTVTNRAETTRPTGISRQRRHGTVIVSGTMTSPQCRRSTASLPSTTGK